MIFRKIVYRVYCLDWFVEKLFKKCFLQGVNLSGIAFFKDLTLYLRTIRMSVHLHLDRIYLGDFPVS